MQIANDVSFAVIKSKSKDDADGRRNVIQIFILEINYDSVFPLLMLVAYHTVFIILEYYEMTAAKQSKLFQNNLPLQYYTLSLCKIHTGSR